MRGLGYTKAESYADKPGLLVDFVNQVQRTGDTFRDWDTGFTFTRSTTKTYFDNAGQIQTAAIDAAAFDHDASGNALGLSLHPSATNLLTYATPDAALPTNWTAPGGTGSRATATLGNGISGVEFTGSGGDEPYIQQSVTLTASTAYTVSVYVDSDATETDTVLNVSGLSDATGDLSKTAADADSDGRVTATFTTGSDVSGAIAYGMGADGAGSSGGTVTMGGVQLEAGLAPTPFIPTSASTVTRGGDVLSMVGISDWFGPAGGLAFARCTSGIGTDTSRAFVISDNGSFGDRVDMYFQTTPQVIVRVSADGSTTNLTSGTVTDDCAAAIYVKPDEQSLSANGGAVDTATRGVSAADRLWIGHNNGTRQLWGHMQSFGFYPDAVKVAADLEAISA